MKNSAYLLLIVLFFSISTSVFTDEVIKKVTGAFGDNGEFVPKIVFYINDKEIATQIFNNDTELIEQTGNIPDGIVKSDGLEPGTYIEYTYKNNRKNGKAVTYNEGGHRLSVQNYVNGELSGLQQGFREDGTLKDEYIINHDKLSIHKEYYENGKLKSEEIYENRKTISKKNYDEEGNLILPE